MLALYTNGKSDSAVSKLIDEMLLTPEQKEIQIRIINQVLTDSFYSIALGLDGCASLGGVQSDYSIKDENGSSITEGGDLESHAWEAFQND